MRSRTIPALIFALWVGLSSASSIEHERIFAFTRLPRGMATQISISSTKKFLDAIDAAVAASTTSMKTPLSTEKLFEGIETVMPFLSRDNGLDLELHILFPPGLNRFALEGAVIVLGNADFHQVVAALEERDALMDVAEGEERFTVWLERASPFTFERAGDGYLVGSAQPHLVKLVRWEMDREWRPDLWMDGEAGILVDIPGAWLLDDISLAGPMFRVRQWLKEGTAPALEGVDIEAVGRVLDQADALGAAAKAELSRIMRLGLDLRVSGERIGLMLRIQSEKGTLLYDIGDAAMSKSIFHRLDLIGHLSTDTPRIWVAASYDDVISDLLLRNFVGAFEIMKAAFSRQAESLLYAGARFVASRQTKNITQVSLGKQGFDCTTWHYAENPLLLLDAIRLMAIARNSIYRELFPGLGGGDAIDALIHNYLVVANWHLLSPPSESESPTPAED